MTELDKLHEWLKGHGYRVERCDETPCASLVTLYASMNKPTNYGERHQLIVRDKAGKTFIDVICHHGTYGYEAGMLEIMGPKELIHGTDSCVEGWLTAEEIEKRLEILPEKDKVRLGLILREEPYRPVRIDSYTYKCGKCGAKVMFACGLGTYTHGESESYENWEVKKFKYCPECGTAVKWDS